MRPNDYWVHDGALILLPKEMTDSDGFIWTDLANNEVAQQKLGLTKASAYPDYDDATQRPVWDGVGGWTIEDLPPPVTIATVVQISQLDFQNLLTDAELSAWNKVKKQVAALTPADYDSADPSVQMLIKAEIAQNKYDSAKGVELTSPDTQTFVSQLMVGLGILTAERAAQVLANQLPPAPAPAA